MARKSDQNTILFREDARIGFAEAEDDLEFLRDCYIDFGQAARALDSENPGSLLVGRTGSGKTAALVRIRETENHVISLDPQDLSLNFISNSNVLSFFHEIGVNLDLFFQLLWRHVLCVELLNYHYRVRSKTDAESMLEKIQSVLGGNEAKKFALSYLEECGANFWLETQSRIKELVENFENELKAGVDLSAIKVPINAAASSKISQEQKTEFSDAAKKVVSNVQIRRLSDLINLMSQDIFVDQKRNYFVLIDKLDEQWVDDSLRYRLIQALIETVRSFRKIRTVKFVVCLRDDLIERVFKYTRSSGFQEEKYEDYIIPIRWNEDELFQVVDTRISSLFRRKYTKDNVGFFDIFPPSIGHEKKVFNYLIQRTQNRPRDIIAFINLIFQHAAGRTNISKGVIDKAEVEYSRKRAEALCTEWADEHPHLNTMIGSLRGLPTRFWVREVSENTIDHSIMKLSDLPQSPDNIPQLTQDYFRGEKTFSDLYAAILVILYKVGAIGVKTTEGTPVQYCYLSSYTLQIEDVVPDLRVSIAPMLWSYIGTLRYRRQKVRGELTD